MKGEHVFWRIIMLKSIQMLKLIGKVMQHIHIPTNNNGKYLTETGQTVQSVHVHVYVGIYQVVTIITHTHNNWISCLDTTPPRRSRRLLSHMLEYIKPLMNYKYIMSDFPKIYYIPTPTEFNEPYVPSHPTQRVRTTHSHRLQAIHSLTQTSKFIPPV